MDTSLQGLQKQVADLTKQVKSLQQAFSNHDHDGTITPNISQSDITPSIRASGNITMSTDGRTYSLGLISNPTSILFYGVATHTTAGTIDIRAFLIGNAQLGKSFYFQPKTPSSVTAGGLPEVIIQSSTYFGVTGSNAGAASAVHALADEEHLVDVEYPAKGTIVARATVTLFTVDHVEVQVSLADGWAIQGNFVVT